MGKYIYLVYPSSYKKHKHFVGLSYDMYSRGSIFSGKISFTTFYRESYIFQLCSARMTILGGVLECCNKMKKKGTTLSKHLQKYHTVRRSPKSIRKITNTGNIDITSTKYMTTNFPIGCNFEKENKQLNDHPSIVLI